MDSNIETILGAVNIIDEVSPFVKLKKSGGNYSGLCPFHSEKTPSFHVNEAKGLYHCFGCGKGGNVIGFLMDIRGESFKETIGYLQQKYHITLTPSSFNERIYKSKDSAASDISETKEICRLALNFFYENLFIYQSNSRNVMDYLRSRNISEKTSQEFKLGYAPAMGGLAKLLSNNRLNLDLAVSMGFLYKKSGSYLDRFINKLIIPIFDQTGEPIAFASRILSGEGPKYINTNNSLIFNKNKTLFGFGKSLKYISESNSVIVVEGYFDMISLYANGIKNAVATMGTALSRNHILNLARVCDEVVLLYDGDEAGLNAISRGIELFQAFMDNPEKMIYAVSLNTGEDPDSFIRKYGANTLVKLINSNKKRPVEFVIDHYINKFFKDAVDGSEALENKLTSGKINNIGSLSESLLKKKIIILDNIFPFLRDIKNSIIFAYYINLVSAKLNIEEKLVHEYISSKIKDNKFKGGFKDRFEDRFEENRATYWDSFHGASAINNEPAVKDGLSDDIGFSASVEELILGKIFQDWTLTKYINDDILKEFANEDIIRIIKKIRKKIRDNGAIKNMEIDDICSEVKDPSKWEKIYYGWQFKNGSENGEIEAQKYFTKLVIKLKINNLKTLLNKKLSELKKGSKGSLVENSEGSSAGELLKIKSLIRDLEIKMNSL